MEEELRKAQIENGLPDFGDPRLTYGRIDNDQALYLDGLIRYATAIGDREPLSNEELYCAYLASLAEIERQVDQLNP